MWGMDLDTWVSLAVLASMFAALYVALRREIGLLRTELKDDISSTCAELKQDIARVDERVSKLDDKLSKVDQRVASLDGRMLHLEDRLTRVEDQAVRVEDRMTRMDDRIFTLAVALKPLIDDAQRLSASPKL